MLHRIIRSWYTGHWCVCCYIWYSEEGPGWAVALPRPLLAVPNVTAHPSMASVPVTVLLHDGPMLCGFNVVVKGLTELSLCYSTVHQYNGEQWCEQFLQVSWLDRALILFDLALCLPSASVYFVCALCTLVVQANSESWTSDVAVAKNTHIKLE